MSKPNWISKSSNLKNDQSPVTQHRGSKMDLLKINIRLDTLGQLCPQPIIETAQKIKKLKKGQILEIISDDWGMTSDLPAWCKSTGHILVSIKEEKDLIRCYVKKRGKESKKQRLGE